MEILTDQIDLETDQSEMHLLLRNGSKDFYNYLSRLNMMQHSNSILVLPDKQHFYYDITEIQQFDTIINIKKLNYIKKLDHFIYSLYCVVKKDSYFCGCFMNNKTPMNISGNHKWMKFVRALLLIFDSIMARLLSEKDIYALFKAHDFEIVDMKEIHGVTYFYAKKV